MLVGIQIEGDYNTGAVRIKGHIDDMRIAHWLLGEALRMCSDRARKRDEAANNGHAGLVVVQGGLPPLP